jgi:DNA polymerase III subunit gamma/tau
MTALYRTYRSLDFSQVVGQEAVVRTLRNAIEHDQVRQAYLFAGPRGTGKTSMARILAKALNAEGGPSADFDPTTRIARAIADGTALDVVEMDAASQRGIDEVREIRERAMLQPAEGRYKVYIVDEAHQLTPAAWNALLKLIEEPPPHLVFVFCTTELSKVIPTVRSRCQTFVFQRPRLQEIVTVLRRVCDGEEIDAPDSALSLVARGAGGSFRDAISTLDQLAAATGKRVSVQDVLQLGAAVEEDALFRLCDTIVDRDVAGALVLVEELSERGQDLGQLTKELLEHLRHLLLVQHLGHVPASLPLTEESSDRLREQANQLPEPTVLRLIDLLAVVIEDERQGGDPRLPLELALVKVTRPQSDLARESLVHRVEVLESRLHAGASAAESWGPSPVPAPAAGPAPVEQVPAPSDEAGHEITLEQMHEAWARSVVPAVKERSIPVATLLSEASPTGLDDDTLTLAFQPGAEFHRKQVDEPKNLTVLRDALYEVTGRRLTVVTTLAEETDADSSAGEDGPVGEQGLISLLVTDLNATEVEEMP